MAPADSAPLTLYLLKRVELAVRARIDEIVRPAGLTTNQYTALTVLERHDDMSSAQLARHSFVTAQSMADMITTLEARGLIERPPDRAPPPRDGSWSPAPATRAPGWKTPCTPGCPRRTRPRCGPS